MTSGSNVWDVGWLNYFKKQEIDEIRNYEGVEVPTIPDAIIQYLHQRKGLKNSDIASDKKWIQDSFIQAISLIKSLFIPINKTKTTEGGFLKRPGRKMDFIFSYNDYEVGCGECGMDVTTKCTKELSDCGHKMPKVMRDMLSKLVSYSPSLKRKLFISGYYNGEKPLKMVLLDTPVGYVTRYDALKFYWKMSRRTYDT
ncbi:hypothetical protein V8B55DRAFT_1568658 [Mucor lusitanicus]